MKNIQVQSPGYWSNANWRNILKNGVFFGFFIACFGHLLQLNGNSFSSTFLTWNMLYDLCISAFVGVLCYAAINWLTILRVRR